MNTNLLLLTLAGCVLENDIGGKDKEAPGGFDSGTTPTVDTGTDTSAPPPVEECNGADDDADGEVDEGYPDENANGRADCLDEECPASSFGAHGAVPIVTACEAALPVTVTDPWNLAVELQYTGAPP